MDRANRDLPRLMDRILVGVLLLLVMVLLGVGAARAAEIVPSVGVSRSTSGDGSLKTFAGPAPGAIQHSFRSTSLGVALEF